MAFGAEVKKTQSTKWRNTFWSLAALIVGGLTGSALADGDPHSNPLMSALGGIGTLWITALRMVALPLAISNLTCAMVRDRHTRAAGRIGGAVAIYVALLLLGAVIVLVTVPPILQGATVDRAAITATSKPAGLPAQQAGGVARGTQAAGDVIGGLLPSNLLDRVIGGSFFGILVFAALFGLALRHTSGETGGTVIRFAEGVTATLMILVRWITAVSPVAMFALAATFAASTGGMLAGILGQYVLLECVLMLAYALLLYPITAVAGSVPLRAFACAALGPQIVAVSTRSSLASLPSLLKAGEELLPADPEP